MRSSKSARANHTVLMIRTSPGQLILQIMSRLANYQTDVCKDSECIPPRRGLKDSGCEGKGGYVGGVCTGDME